MRLARAALLAVMTGMIAVPASAQRFDPFGDPYTSSRPVYDYSQRPKRSAPAAQGAKAKPPAPAASSSFWSMPDDDDAPQAAPKLQAAPAGILQGGPRPAIAAETPPTVSHNLGYAPGSVVVDTRGRQLLYILSSSQAYRYPISVGREGFTWTGTEKISRVADWPDWRPPAEMRKRDPRLPEVMTGGVNNPLGARALYLGGSLYRIHGTNDTKSIGYAASSGCFRMRNAHVMHLSGLAKIGTTVHVLASLPGVAKKKVAGRKTGGAG